MNGNSVATDVGTDSVKANELLASLLARIPGRFFGPGQQGCAVYVPAGRHDYSILCDRHAFNGVAGQARSLKALFVDAEGWPVAVTIASQQISRLLSGGMTIWAEGLAKTGDLGGFLAACSAAAPGAGEFRCDAFLSPPASAFGMHIDPHPTLVLQVSGSRRWRFVAQPERLDVMIGLMLPPGCDTLELPWGSVHRPDLERVEEVTLGPGDALYLPTGCWHEGLSLGESFSLCIGTESLPPLAAFRRAIAEGVTLSSRGESTGTEQGAAGKSALTPESFGIVTAGMSVQDIRAAWCDLLAQRCD